MKNNIFNILIVFTISILLPSFLFSGEKECNKLVQIQEKAWSNMVAETAKYNWGKKSYPSIRDWNDKQIKARNACSVNGHLYDGIITLNKNVKSFGKAGGFTVPYNE